jgi:hypothetical protein
MLLSNLYLGELSSLIAFSPIVYAAFLYRVKGQREYDEGFGPSVVVKVCCTRINENTKPLHQLSFLSFLHDIF